MSEEYIELTKQYLNPQGQSVAYGSTDSWTDGILVHWRYDPGQYTLHGIQVRFKPWQLAYRCWITSKDKKTTYNSLAQGLSIPCTKQTQITLTLNLNAYTKNQTEGDVRIRFRYASAGGGSGSTYKDIEVVLLVTENRVYEESTISVDDVVMGANQPFRIDNPNIQYLYHVIDWSYRKGSYVEQGSITLDKGISTGTWLVPDNSNLYGITNRIQGTAIIRTYRTDNTQVGVSKSCTIYAIVPNKDETKPLISDITVSPESGIMQGQTIVTIDYTPRFQYGAKLASANIETPDYSYNDSTGQYHSFTILPNTLGKYDISITITDTRGYTATRDTSIQVAQCIPPRFTFFTAVRCDINGTINDEGTSILVKALADAEIDGQNEDFTYTASFFKSNREIIGTMDLLPADELHGFETPYVIASTSEGFSTESSYIVEITAVPQHTGLKSIKTTVDVGVSVYTIYRLIGGKGIAFGGIANKKGVEVNDQWPFYTHGKEIIELIIDAAHPVGSILSTINTGFNPNDDWPWTHWESLSGLVNVALSNLPIPIDTWVRTQ